jgi:glyoxylase-like metal-dependent hydrolase (beta-lactamase superfamily II)
MEKRILLKSLSLLKIPKLNAIVLTHVHTDHVANVEQLRKQFHCPVIVSEKESYYLEQGFCSIPKGTTKLTKVSTDFLGRREITFQRFEACQSALRINDKFSLKEFGIDAFIISTPGHTEGSISIIVENNIAIVGDTMVRKINGNIYPPFANRADLLKVTWERLHKTKCKIFLPSHGKEITRDSVAWNYKKHFK